MESDILVSYSPTAILAVDQAELSFPVKSVRSVMFQPGPILVCAVAEYAQGVKEPRIGDLGATLTRSQNGMPSEHNL